MIKSVLKIFGTQNDKIVKNYLKKVKKINALEAQYEALDDEALKTAFNALRAEVQSGEKIIFLCPNPWKPYDYVYRRLYGQARFQREALFSCCI